MYKFSKESQDEILTMHPDLRLIFYVALHYSDIDFGIEEGKRLLKTQQKYFKNEASTCDGIKKRSKHQGYPTDNDLSYAGDVYAYVNGKTWDDIHLSYLGGVIMTTAKLLLARGDITHELRWGANWDRDGVLVIDQKLKDLPHYELIVT